MITPWPKSHGWLDGARPKRRDPCRPLWGGRRAAAAGKSHCDRSGDGLKVPEIPAWCRLSTWEVLNRHQAAFLRPKAARLFQTRLARSRRAGRTRRESLRAVLVAGGRCDRAQCCHAAVAMTSMAMTSVAMIGKRLWRPVLGRSRHTLVAIGSEVLSKMRTNLHFPRRSHSGPSLSTSRMKASSHRATRHCHRRSRSRGPIRSGTTR